MSLSDISVRKCRVLWRNLMKTKITFLAPCGLFLSFPLITKQKAAKLQVFKLSNDERKHRGWTRPSGSKTASVFFHLVFTSFYLSTMIIFTPLANADLLTGYTGCTNENRFDNQCLPNVSNVEFELNSLQSGLVSMDIDRQSWRGFNEAWKARPSDDPTSFIDHTAVVDIFSDWDSVISLFTGELTEHLSAFQKAKKHIQSIQYIDDPVGNKYLVTSISDETDTDAAAIQLIKTDEFAAGSAGGWDDIAEQRLLNQDPYDSGVAEYNHPGGSQLIGNYLFLALEDFTEPKQHSATGVWRIRPKQDCTYAGECINFLYKVPHPPQAAVLQEAPDDNHQATVAVTKLSDNSFLLAACVYKDCDYIDFYKSPSPDELPEESSDPTLAQDPGFTHIGQWVRNEENAFYIPEGEDPDPDNWSDCGPQNMNFAADTGGNIYLVMFGGETVHGIASCDTGLGFQDHLYGYKVRIEESDITPVDIQLEFTNKVRVLPNPSPCVGYHVFTEFFHGLNFLAGSGLWLRPEGKDTIAFLATEHYDSCTSYARPVNGKTRWGVSSNWNGEPQIWVDDYKVEVDEGKVATNTGIFASGDAVTLSANIGSVLEDSTDTWSWSWLTNDGPDDSQTVTVTRTDGGDSDSAYFELLVNNVPPTAEAGPDQVVECVHGNTVALDATGSSDPGDDTLSFAWAFSDVPGSGAPPFDDPNSATPSFLPNALGTYLAEVTVTDDDGASDTDNVAILFEDTTPPVIASLGATPDVLWPPNGKMVGVEVSVSVTDSCDAAPVCAISSITSNEPELDESDSEITGPFTANLRAKRLGAGDGRTYSIAVECSDYAGNSTTRTTAVIVPHDQDNGIE